MSSGFHELHRSWRWHANIKRFNSTGDWTQEVLEVTQTPINSVETFWGVFDKMCRVEDLSAGSDYMFFSDDISPMWEDEANKGGGRWSFCVNKNTRDMGSNKAWEELLMLLIGNTFENEYLLCGAVIGKKRSYDRISIWIKNTDEETIKEVGKEIRKHIRLSKGITLNFQYHSDVMDGNLKPIFNV